MIDLNEKPVEIKSPMRRGLPENSPRLWELLPKDTVKLRLETFNTYPKHLLPKPKDLAQAGFFYTGVGDKVICFSCGVGLNEWEPDDDAWFEHRKFSPDCAFLRNGGVRRFLEVKDKKEELEEKKEETIPDDLLCVVCRENIRNVLSLPCRHLATCQECNDKLDSCVVCRKEERQRIIINYPEVKKD